MSHNEKRLPLVNSPADLRDLSPAELGALCDEIRDFLIRTVSCTGGHLGSNLGVVELTVALHAVFDTPRDRLVFDTGHQGYVHKILTGRRKRMHSIRQHGGLSGFLKREESEYDTFGAGHAGTALSAAYGMAVARDLAGEDYHVVALVGDASLTAGMAFEALNHAGDSRRDMIVVLNDNRMSIAENVGALRRYFNKIIRAPIYNRVRHDIDELLANIPPILGTRVLDVADRLREGMKNLIVPDMLFEELGFRYFGPVNGHDMKQLVETLRDIKQLRGEPRLVHVITEKGHGYAPAREADDKLHGVMPFDIRTGKAEKKSTAATYTAIFAEILIRLAEHDARIVAITAAMPAGTGLDRFMKAYPDRCFDVGIAEQHAVTFAGGLATAGYKPVVAIYSTFLQRGFDQIVHDIALQNLDVTFAMDRGGIVGEDGETHQGLFDLGLLRMVPNMVLAAPMDENELQHLLATVVAYPGPAAIRYPRGAGEGAALDTEEQIVPIGKGVLLAPGRDVALLGIGTGACTALKAASLLREYGVEPAVFNARFVKPLDAEAILELARSTRRVVTIEENVIAGGFGSAVGELLARHECHDVRLLTLGLPDCFLEHGSQPVLRDKYGLTAEKVVARVLAWLRRPLRRETSQYSLDAQR